MALLLALYQKMRITREINELTLREAQISSKQKRVTKNIERTQKRYTSLIAQIGEQAKRMQNNMTIALQSQVGMSYMQVNPYSQASAFSLNYAQQAFTSGQLPTGKKDDEGKAIFYKDDNAADKFNAMYAEYSTKGTGAFTFKDASGADVTSLSLNGQDITKDDFAAFQLALQAGNQAQSQAQMWLSNATQQMQSNVSIWEEAQKTRLEAEQDAALEPLNYEDTMLDLEKTQLEARLEKLRAEKQSYEQLASEEAKDSAPKFGLG